MTPSAHLNVSLREPQQEASSQLLKSPQPAFLTEKNPKKQKFSNLYRRFNIGFFATVTTITGLLVACGCTTAPKVGGEVDPAVWRDSAKLFDSVCKIGRKSGAVSGRVSVKVKSKESSGQFPATVLAKDPEQLTLEVTNLFGGTEALITIDGGVYKIDVPGKPERTEKGLGSWGGIPLRWASELFLGRFPCPVAGAEPKLETPSKGQLKMTALAPFGEVETFVYDFRAEGGVPWPHHAVWQRGLKNGANVVRVEFRFDDPDPATLIPVKWEAVSEQGEVKVRWKERKTAP